MIDKIKRDKEVNWNKAINFIPKKDEIIIYDCEDGTKIKIGDGIRKINELDFSDTTIPEVNVDRVEDEIIIMEER